MNVRIMEVTEYVQPMASSVTGDTLTLWTPCEGDMDQTPLSSQQFMSPFDNIL
jgi:hypothetical protein